MQKLLNYLTNLIKRLTSRKFLLTVAGGLTLAANGQWTELVALISVYIGTEGAGDVVDRFKTPEVTKAELKKEVTLIENGYQPSTGERRSIVAGQDIAM
jgi:hypothetical protein